MQFYVLRHVRTGKVMPQSSGRGGYSYWQPEHRDSFGNATDTPRLFTSEASANRARSQWAAGLRKVVQCGSDWDTWSKLTVTPCGRRADDLEICSAVLTLAVNHS